MGRGKRSQTLDRSGVLAGRQGEFNPLVSFADEVIIRLPELNLIGAGESFEAAKDDLLEEILVYAEQFRQSPALQGASNRQDHGRLLDLVEAAEREGRLSDLIFIEPGAVV